MSIKASEMINGLNSLGQFAVLWKMQNAQPFSGKDTVSKCYEKVQHIMLAQGNTK